MTTRLALASTAAAVLAVALTIVAVGGAGAAARATRAPLTSKAILFASDGMRPDLVER